MLDISYIRNNSELLKQNIADRNVKGEQFDVDAFLLIDKKRTELTTKVEKLRAIRNVVSETNGKPSDEDIKKGRGIREQIKVIEYELRGVQARWQVHMDWFPNITHESMPVGADESGNKEIKVWGDKKKFDFNAQSHIDIGERLDLIDVTKSGEVSGSRFSFLKNEAALLHWGLMSFAIKKVTQRGFNMMIPPVIVKSRPLYGTGYFPSETDQIYELTQGEALEDEQR